MVNLYFLNSINIENYVNTKKNIIVRHGKCIRDFYKNN